MSTKLYFMEKKHLKKRGCIWWYSRRVPKQIAHLYPDQVHIEKSLNTDSLKAARLQRDQINGELAAQIQSAFDPRRMQFKAYLEQLGGSPRLGEPTYQGYLNHEDFLGAENSDEVARAAVNHAVYGKPVPVEYSVTLKELLSGWMIKNHAEKEDKKQRHKRSVQKFLTWLRLPDIPAQQIDKRKVVEYVEHLGIDYTGTTIEGELSRLRGLWSYGHKRAELPHKEGPFHDHDLSEWKKPTKKKQLFSRAELKKIFDECPEHLVNLVQLALYTGARQSELCAAHEEIVDDVRCMVIKGGKTESAARFVPLSSQVEHIRLPLGIEAKAAGRQFSKFKNSHITRDRSRSFHSLRAHFISAAQRAHTPEFETASAAGHKTGNTMSYGYYARADVKRLAGAMQTIANQIDVEWLTENPPA